MRATILLLLTLWACGKDHPTTPEPYTSSYRLTDLLYEDVYPGHYTAKLSGFIGTARLDWGDGIGALVVESPVTGLMVVSLPDGIQEQPKTLLPAGAFAFSFSVDTAGVVTFKKSPDLWPFVPGVLTDSTYSYDRTQCYDQACTDYIRLAFRWVRE